MKHPFWFINSILFILFITALGYVLFSKKRVPNPVDFEPDYVQPLKETTPVIDLNKIYNNDLFGTAVETDTPAPVAPPKTLSPMPQPPTPIVPQAPEKPVLQFLEPLSITLKGIMIVGNEKDNVAIIQNSTTQESNNYKVGDKIQDGLLLRILKHKIILIRSNGQQETLFINQQDAELEQEITNRQDWSTVVQQVSDTSYIVDPHTFTARVRNLSQFIDMLNLSTVYKQGKNIGCRLGSIETDSLGSALGLVQGDIITTVNGIPATTTDNRLKIYQTVTEENKGPLSVDVLRAESSLLFTYSITEFVSTGTAADSIHEPMSERQLRMQKRKIFEEQHKLAPTIKQMQSDEKKNMMSHGRTSRAHARRNRGVVSQSVLSERKPYDPHA